MVACRARASRRPTVRSYLIAAGTAGLLTVTVVSAAEQLPVLPEIDHVNQEFRAGAAGEAGWVPQPVIASPLGVDGGLALLHEQLAGRAELKERAC